jgi:Skp family chaperone for outer membrane proteins
MEPQLITKIQGGIDQGIQGIATGKKQMQAAKEKMGKAPAAMAMEKSIEQMDTLSTQMEAMKQAVPGAFDTALSDYQAAIDAKSTQIEQAFQDAVNGGFRNIYRTTIIAAAIAVLIVLLYDPKRERAEE